MISWIDLGIGCSLEVSASCEGVCSLCWCFLNFWINWLLIFIDWTFTWFKFLFTNLFKDPWGITVWLSVLWFYRRTLLEFRLVLVWVWFCIVLLFELLITRMLQGVSSLGLKFRLQCLLRKFESIVLLGRSTVLFCPVLESSCGLSVNFIESFFEPLIDFKETGLRS